MFNLNFKIIFIKNYKLRTPFFLTLLFLLFFSACSVNKPYFRSVEEVFASDNLQKDEAYYKKLFDVAQNGNRDARAAAISFISKLPTNSIDSTTVESFILNRLSIEKDYNVQILLVNYFLNKPVKKQYVDAVLALYASMPNPDVQIAIIKYASSVLSQYSSERGFVGYNKTESQAIVKTFSGVCSNEFLQELTTSVVFTSALKCNNIANSILLPNNGQDTTFSFNNSLAKVLKLVRSGLLYFVK